MHNGARRLSLFDIRHFDSTAVKNCFLHFKTIRSSGQVMWRKTQMPEEYEHRCSWKSLKTIKPCSSPSLSHCYNGPLCLAACRYLLLSALILNAVQVAQYACAFSARNNSPQSKEKKLNEQQKHTKSHNWKASKKENKKGTMCSASSFYHSIWVQCPAQVSPAQSQCCCQSSKQCSEG